MIKIGIIGSCITRDVFNSEHVKNWKDYFEVVAYQSQVTFPSLVSDPIIYEKSEAVYENMNDFEIRQINNELDKNFIYKLKNSNIDYLIIDFYGDLFFGIVKDIYGGYLTNKKWLFTRSNIFNQVTEEGQSLSFEKNFKKYFELWTKAVDNFFNNYLINIDTTVIIHQSEFKSSYFENNEKKFVKDIIGIDKDIKFLNYIWHKMTRYIMNKYPNIYLIDQTKEKYSLDPNHIWGVHYVHFEKRYYIDFKDKLIKLIIDLELSKTDEEQKNKQNLKLQSDDWQFKNETLDLVKHEVNLISQDNENYIFKQNPSKAIRIMNNSHIHIAFEVFVDSSIKLDDRRILAIRTFNDEYKYSQKEANQYTYYHLDNYQYDKWIQIEIDFNPLDGKYMKVIPILFKNGHIIYKNFQIFID